MNRDVAPSTGTATHYSPVLSPPVYGCCCHQLPLYFIQGIGALYESGKLAAANRVAWAASALGATLALTITVAQLAVHAA